MLSPQRSQAGNWTGQLIGFSCGQHITSAYMRRTTPSTSYEWRDKKFPSMVAEADKQRIADKPVSKVIMIHPRDVHICTVWPQWVNNPLTFNMMFNSLAPGPIPYLFDENINMLISGLGSNKNVFLIDFCI